MSAPHPRALLRVSAFEGVGTGSVEYSTTDDLGKSVRRRRTPEGTAD